ncbi:MAG: glutamyl-tRNA reductase [Candidatus Bathyarchaeia archaeon]|jgi:glutamyl-tRNA reductase
MRSFAKAFQLINVRLTHKTASVPLLEAASFKDKKKALVDFCSLTGVRECVLLQTCNRVELYLLSDDCADTADLVRERLICKVGGLASEISRAIEISFDEAALMHLLRVAAGLESMVIGEDQVITQVWDAYLEAEDAKTVGPVFKHLFRRAVKIGRRVRKETGINKGAVSVGSAAVELAESLLGKLDEKRILVMGAGEMGTLVSKALAKRCLNPVFIANRTYDRAVRLAAELSGKAVKFDKLGEVIADADVVICSTSAPHYLLTKDLMTKFVRRGHGAKPLVIIDISNPRNVEETIKDLEGVALYNIDDLRLITERNRLKREKKVEKAQKIIDEELALLSRELKTETVREVIAELLSRAEKARQSELAKALSMLGNIGDREKKIISDLTSVLMKKTFVPLVENLRSAAKDNDVQTIENAIKLFNVAVSNQSERRS